MAAGHARQVLTVAVATMLLLAAACSSTSDADEARSKRWPSSWWTPPTPRGSRRD